MRSDARARARDEEAAVTSTLPDSGPTGATVDRAGVPGTDEARTDHVDPARPTADEGGDPATPRSRPALPLVPVLAVLLVLLLAGGAYLWFTRPGESAVTTGDYAEALQAARSGVVDLTSFDYLTIDDDVEQLRRVATGTLRDESITQLEGRRQQITDLQAVVNSEVVGAGVTRVDGDDATVLMVIQATQESTASPQAEIVRYRIEVTLEKSGGRWLLSGITGAGAVGDE